MHNCVGFLQIWSHLAADHKLGSLCKCSKTMPWDCRNCVLRNAKIKAEKDCSKINDFMRIPT